MSPSTSSRGCFSARGQMATSPQLQPPAHFLLLWEDIAQWPGAVRTRSLLHVQPCPVSKDQLGQVLKEAPIFLSSCAWGGGKTRVDAEVVGRVLLRLP